MSNDHLIVVRDKVELFTEKSLTFKTTVEDITKDGAFLVTVPSIGGVSMPLKKGQELYLAFFRGTGRYVARVRVIGLKDKRSVNYVLLRQISMPVKEQRRNFYRLTISLKTQVFRYEEIDEGGILPVYSQGTEEVLLDTARSINISISGISIKTKRTYEEGEKYRLKIFFDWPHNKVPPFAICAEVKRVLPEPGTEEHQIGFHFIQQTEAMSEYIAKYILIQQQKQIRQRRLVEGD